MDSLFNSSDIYMPKVEYDEDSSLRKETKLTWSSDNTMKLIDTMEKECRELWDVKHPLNKDRAARQAKLEFLADMFETSSEEISRKIHNLRSQFNNELRKMKRRQVSAGEGAVSGWEYFDALSFLLRASPTVGEPLYAVDAVNLELAEFQADEEEEFGAAARAHLSMNNLLENSPGGVNKGPNKPAVRVAASAPPPLPPSAYPHMWPEEPLPRLRPGINADECQIFGDFVASELRTLHSNESRKKLKRMIQKAILQIGEEEDGNIFNG